MKDLKTESENTTKQKQIKKFYLSKKELRRVKRICKREGISVNSYLTSQILELKRLCRQNTLFLG